MLLEDKTFTDQCYHSFYTAIAGKFPEYFENPTPYDIAETIRDVGASKWCFSNKIHVL